MLHFVSNIDVGSFRTPLATKMATPKKVSRKTAKSTSQSKKAGLVFPVGRIGTALRKGRYAPRISKSAAVSLSSVLEYLTSENLTTSSSARNRARR